MRKAVVIALDAVGYRVLDLISVDRSNLIGVIFVMTRPPPVILDRFRPSSGVSALLPLHVRVNHLAELGKLVLIVFHDIIEPVAHGLKEDILYLGRK